jgi:hypothetical protein
LVGEGDGNFGISIVKIKFRDNFVVGVIGDVCDMRIVRGENFEDIAFGVEIEDEGVIVSVPVFSVNQGFSPNSLHDPATRKE